MISPIEAIILLEPPSTFMHCTSLAHKPQQVTCGSCGSSNETCAAGDPHGHPPDTNTQWLWTCRNIPHIPGNCGKREDDCSQAK